MGGMIVAAIIPQFSSCHRPQLQRPNPARDQGRGATIFPEGYYPFNDLTPRKRVYLTGWMRRVYLRGRDNVLKRVLIHVGALNLSLVTRKTWGKGTPRGWQGYS